MTEEEVKALIEKMILENLQVYVITFQEKDRQIIQVALKWFDKPIDVDADFISL